MQLQYNIYSVLLCGVHGCLVVSVLDCLLRGPGFKSLSNSAMMSAPTIHCWLAVAALLYYFNMPSYFGCMVV